MLVVGKVLPFFLVMLAGAALARARLLDQGGVTGLSRYVYWLGFPALLVHSLGAGAPPSPAVALGLVGYAAGALCPFLVAAALARAMGWTPPIRAALPMCAGLGNTGFLGLPLAVSLFGVAALGWAGAIVAVDWVLLASLSGAQMYRRPGEAWLPALCRGLFTPIVAGAVIGVGQMLTGWRWPAAADAAISMLAASATATGLVALGAVLAARREVADAPGAPETLPVWSAVALKLIVGPACVAGATALAGAPVAFRHTAVLMAACPTAVTVFVQARQAGVFGDGAARVVAISTLVSALTLTGLAALLAG